MAIALVHLSKYLRHFHHDRGISTNLVDVGVFLGPLFYQFCEDASKGLHHSVDEILQQFDETMKNFLPEPRVLAIEEEKEEEEEEDEICMREKRKNDEGDDDGGDEKRIKSQ